VPRRGWPAGVADAVGLVGGYACDLLLGDPRRFHPVAGYGLAAAALERKVYAPSRTAGAEFTAVAVSVPVAAGLAAQLATRRRPIARAMLVTAATWATLGGTSLRREAEAMRLRLHRGDLAGARARLPNLCGRDPEALSADELARATVESVAENTSDAVVAPLVWGAVGGLPGLLGYRAVNTLDVANLVPARLTAVLTIGAAGLVRGRPAEALRVWRRDRNDHPSPNAGQCEAAMAGALGVRLGGRNVYRGRTEVRPLLGDGPRPRPVHIARASRLSATVGVLALAAAAAVAVTRAAGRDRFGYDRSLGSVVRPTSPETPSAGTGAVAGGRWRPEPGRVARRNAARRKVARRKVAQ
jgi:adenosylcobinamide-phosphate synthase